MWQAQILSHGLQILHKCIFFEDNQMIFIQLFYNSSYKWSQKSSLSLQSRFWVILDFISKVEVLTYTCKQPVTPKRTKRRIMFWMTPQLIRLMAFLLKFKDQVKMRNIYELWGNKQMFGFIHKEFASFEMHLHTF